jgi:hypothetical protein
MQKHEIDGAAKDLKNVRFAQDFAFEMFWQVDNTVGLRLPSASRQTQQGL